MNPGNKNIFDRIDKLKAARKRIQEENTRVRNQRDRRSRLEDLYKQVHRVGPVSIPLPNMFAFNWLCERYNQLESFNLEDSRHVAAMAWICENQTAERASEIAIMSPKQVDAEINAFMAGIDAGDVPHYTNACDEILRAVKKNFLSSQRAELNKALAILDKIPESELQAALE